MDKGYATLDEFLAEPEESQASGYATLDDFLAAPEEPKIFDTKTRLTQPFGNMNPELEKFSGGKNLGADFSAPEGTPLSTPEGDWEVVKSAMGENGGSGNVVKIKNTATGDVMTLEHLSQINVHPGQKLTPGMVIALSGNTGNSTGPHISLPLQNAQGEYQDILQSPYKNYLPAIE